MSKRKRTRRGGRSDADAAAAAPARPDRADRRRAHKQEARQRREAVQRGLRRRRTIRRVAVVGAPILAIGLVAAFVLGRTAEDRRLGQEAERVAAEAGCSEIQTMPDAGRAHLEPGETIEYPQHPATSGTHDASALPQEPRVYTSPVPEPNAVHSLEHGYILMYYRADGGDALPDDVVRDLSRIAQENAKVILSPHASLDEGTALALAAWNRLQTCPATVTAADAATLADAFIGMFRSGGEAPEPSAP